MITLRIQPHAMFRRELRRGALSRNFRFTRREAPES